MATNVTIAVNTGTSDVVYGGVDWVDIDTENDYIVFTAGSNTVQDGETIPNSDKLNQAGIVLTGAEIIVSTYLLADADANELKEIHNMGNQDKRYVVAFNFDGATTSEPVLEVWDDVNMDSIDLPCLGSGLASSSWIKGVVTTSNSPGDNWIGSPLAGSSAGYFLELNNGNGVIDSATTLYCNLKLVIPASQTESGANQPIMVCKYTTN